jgi:hypothetical protein
LHFSQDQCSDRPSPVIATMRKRTSYVAVDLVINGASTLATMQENLRLF